MRLLSITLFAGVVAAGCEDVASIHPFYTADDVENAVTDSRIEGAWISPGLDSAGIDREAPVTWTVTRALDRPGRYLVEVRTTDEDNVAHVETFTARLVADGSRLFFDAEFQSAQDGEMPRVRPAPPRLTAAHVIGRIWIEPDFLRLALIPADWLKEQAPEGSWLSPDDSSLVITAPTAQLRRLLLAHADDTEVFEDAVVLCRPGTDCKARLAENWARRQDDDDALEFAAAVFSRRGDHARAIALRQRLAASNPESVRHQWALSDELFGARRFADARRALAKAEALGSQLPGNHRAPLLENLYRDTVWSYFLEGRYDDTVRLVRSHTASAPNTSAEPILLAYVALQRLGQPAPAAELLREHAARFVGPASEHALLLRALGRVPDLALGDEYFRMKFFDALQRIAAGDGRGRNMLGEVLRAESARYVLASRIELERLGPAR